MPKRTGKSVIAPGIADIAAQRAQDLQIVQLALAGNNGVEIAAQLNISKATVSRTMDRVWARTEQPKAAALRGLWNDRIETVIKALWTKILDGDVGAVNAFVRLAERAAKMNALDQQVAKDAGALASALLGDPAARAERATAILAEVIELRRQGEERDRDDTAGGAG